MIKINVIVRDKSWKKQINNPKKFLENNIQTINKKINFFKNKKISFSILLTSSKDIKLLNKKFRNKDKTTDVLSFPFYNKVFLLKLLKKKNHLYLGDVAINIKEILKKKKKTNFKFEFDKLWIHGLVHLLGHKHYYDKDFKKMQVFEKKLLVSLNKNYDF